MIICNIGIFLDYADMLKMKAHMFLLFVIMLICSLQMDVSESSKIGVSKCTL